jgi:hypothetical protein
MQLFYALLPLLPLVAANGRIRFNAFDHVNCQGFEENYDLNPATVKGNFPGETQRNADKVTTSTDKLARPPRSYSDSANICRMSPYALHGR